MTDIERTRKWLDCCGNYNDDLEHVGCNEECPYWENGTCSPRKPFEDAKRVLETLSSQQGGWR